MRLTSPRSVIGTRWDIRTSRAAPVLRSARDFARAVSWRLGIPEAVDALLVSMRARLGLRPPRISVVIPTIGRATLQVAIDSAAWAHEVVVVYDDAKAPVDAPTGAAVYACGPTRHWGAEQRNLGIARASGTHIAFIDDDDVFTKDAGHAIARAVAARPSRVHIFKMRNGDREYGGYGCVWDGGLGTPMFVVPNDDHVGVWTTRYAGDFDFISSTIAARGRRPRYHPEVIAEIRPDRAA